MGKAPKVSVVIATYNRPEYLLGCLDAISKQTFRDFEIVVVDDGSEDGTAKSLIECTGDNGRYKGIPFTYTWQKNQGAATARNKGVSKAQGEIIAFTDDDCLPDENWLEKGVKYFDDKGVVAVTGQIEKEDKETTPTSCVTYTFNANGFMTANVFYRKTAYKDVGGFDLRFKSFREDSDLGIRIAKTGKGVNEPKSRVIHRIIDYSVLGFFKKHIRLKETYYDVLFYKKHPKEFKILGEFFIWPITTHMLYPYAFIWTIFLIILSIVAQNTTIMYVSSGIFAFSYPWIVFFHTRMRSSIGITHISEHPIKCLGLLSVWWMAMMWDIYQRIKAIIAFRKLLL